MGVFVLLSSFRRVCARVARVDTRLGGEDVRAHRSCGPTPVRVFQCLPSGATTGWSQHGTDSAGQHGNNLSAAASLSGALI